MAARPDQSLPHQTGNWGDLIGAYRLFNNAAVEPAAIQQPHWRITRERCVGHRVVLCVQDTSELDYTGYRAKKGLGEIGRQNGQGLLQHSVLTVLPKGQLIGLLHQRCQVRVPAPANETRQERSARWNEGRFWADGVEAVGRPPEGTRFITVTDRGGDNFATLDACDRMGHGFIVRAQHDRCVNNDQEHLWACMEKHPVLKTIKVKVPARAAARINNKGLGAKSQPARLATVQVRAGHVLLDAPKKDPLHHAARRVYVVYATEVDPPPGVSEPIDWMLLTSEPVKSARAALVIIGYYRRRWVIEEYHKVQKSGCALEHSQLRDVDALRRLAALVGVLAVRMLWLRDLAAPHLTISARTSSSPKSSSPKSSSPRLSGSSGSAAQSPASLQALMPMIWITVVSRLAGVDKPQTFTASQFWRTIAKRGGWMARKHDGRPGWKALWRGWHEIALLVEGAELLTSKEGKRCV
jgi:hypothetical protein